jgi:hypothetical protein
MFKKKWEPAYREFFLVGPNGEEFWNGCSYRKEASAKKDADRMNAHRKRGTITVGFKDRPGGWVWKGRLTLS